MHPMKAPHSAETGLLQDDPGPDGVGPVRMLYDNGGGAALTSKPDTRGVGRRVLRGPLLFLYTTC